MKNLKGMETLREAARLASIGSQGHYALPWIKADVVKYANSKSPNARRMYVMQFFHDTELVLRDVRVPV